MSRKLYQSYVRFEESKFGHKLLYLQEQIRIWHLRLYRIPRGDHINNFKTFKQLKRKKL